MRFIILLLLIPFISISQNNDVQKAQIFFSKGEYEKAVQIYEKLPANKVPRFYSSYLYSLNALSKYNEARKVAQKMYLRDKNNLRYLSDVIIFERKNDDKLQSNKNLNILIKELKSKITHEESWGLKKLKYPIQNKRTGFYYMFEHESNAQTTKELEVEFSRDERVLRWLTVKLNKHAIDYAEKRKKKQIKS